MTVSLGVFCPQSRAPSPSYLESIRSFITNHHVLQSIARDINSLHDIWSMLAEKNPEIARLPQGPRYTKFLTQWLVDGASEEAASTSSGMVALPRLVIIQITQYFQFLESKGITHADFIAQVRDSGGIQGYCGGLPAAVALACAKNEQELAQFTCTAIRLAYAIGLYAELGDNSEIPGATTIVVRLKREDQAEELVRMFPHTYISAITDPKSVSIVGPVKQLADLQAHANNQGLLVQSMGIRGKTHNPENADLAAELAALCQKSDLLDLPKPELLQAPVRSNRTGHRITEGSLTEEIVKTVLASRCEWYQLLSNVAADLKQTGIDSHNLVSFGIGDCVPLMPFNKLGIRVTKTDWSGQTKNQSSRLEQNEISSAYLYPEDAIAIIGASCRLPGANNMDELWELVSKGEDRHEELKSDRFDLYGGYRASQSGNFTKNRKFYGNFIEGVERFDNAFFGINQREMVNMDPQQRILLELSYEAMESSGYTRSHVREHGDAVGCFIGGSFVEYLDNTNAHTPTAYTSTGTIRAFLCGRLSYYFGWTGPAEVIDTACSSSLVAINRAVKAVQRGECSVALAGGVNIITGANNFLDLARAGFLSPTGQCKPFDQHADGYCRAEGAGLVVLKTLKQAQADGDHIMAVIAGAATNQGGLSCGITVPDSKAQAQLYELVLKQAAMSPEQVTYVETHGTGTQAGDPLEVASVRSVFGSSTRAHELHIGSIKGNIGHCETAAGVAGLLKVICMLEHQSIPPQASHQTWNPKIPVLSPDRMAISKTLRTWHAPIRAAVVNSYGAAGSNAAVLCCEAPEAPQGDSLSKPGLKQPIIISAASASSLKNYQKSLVNYLTKTTPQLDIVEIAYTLSEKRRRHKHYIAFETSDTTDLVKALTGDQNPILERSTPNPVVLVFGGQSKQTIGLNKYFYQHFITFSTHINMCDDILQELGYPPILPAVFETGNISDIVVLQTGFVAVQYASALTWIDAGLKVNTLVGHSLGELTTLAVSGMLSIRDCLQLVAARATLMKTKWGQDKGSMLAVFTGRHDLEQLISGVKFSSPDSKLEIACYNSDTSQVVSGDSGAIADLEAHLLSRSPSIKYLRVDTSHGFHSRLVDPILDELERVSSSLNWKEPIIPVELCAQDAPESCLPYSPSDHARNPVFFVDTVQRIERKLGRCIWLEAGMNTPIISMAKRATSQPKSHIFHAISTKDEELSTNIISRTVCSLWQSSLDITHWSFLQGERVLSQVWLPPYQFDATTAWLENIDRAAELQHQLNERLKIMPREDDSPHQRPKMVSLLPDTDKSGNRKRFRVSVEGKRFRTIVAGHAVRRRPLCPASVYLECATMALDIAEDDLQKSNLDFEGLDIQAPLGIGAENVEVVLQELSSHHRWEFTVISRNPANLDKTTLHAKGRVTKSSESKLDTMARLVGKRMQALTGNEDAERMLSRRAYDLFSRVVTYEKFLKGISSILMSDTEAVAKITISPDQPGLDESTVAGVCDAVSLDNFIQVVGLLMNTSDMVGDNEVMVCTGIENSMISKGCNMVDCRSWKVHASYSPTSTSQAIGDVFAFSEDASVAAAFTGCRFTKLDVTRLERLLDPVNRTPGSNKAKKPEISALLSSGPPRIEITPRLTPDSGSAPLSDDELDTPTSIPRNNLREMFEQYTGAAASSILDDAIIADLGLDSLAATAMAEELQSSYDVIIDSQKLLPMTVKELEYRVYGPSSGKPFRGDIQTVLNGVNNSMRPAPKTADQTQRGSTLLANKLTELLVETTGVPSSSIKPQMTLEELGVDSLALTEILSALADESSAALNTDDISLQSKVEEVLRAVGAAGNDGEAGNPGDVVASLEAKSTRSSTVPQCLTPQPKVPMQGNETRMKVDPVAGLRSSDAQFESAARSRGFQNYWNDVAIKQDKLVLAYILEAFKILGVDFASLKEGDRVPSISYQPKHSQVVQRLWDNLEKQGIIRRDNAKTIVRGAKSASSPPSSQLHEQFVRQHAPYAIEAHLLALTGPKLAECLKGDVDPIRLLFGTASANKILEEYYGHSPMLSTLTDQLVTFIMGSLDNSNGGRSATLRILEVGAGTGGTTARLVERLAISGVTIEYTFSDVSSTMVSKAKKRFAQHSWMSFEKLDLERPAPAHMKHRFDIVIGTNCVHATSDKVATISRIREMLDSDGFIVLSEVTRIVGWYDLVFGLLEGWWLADGGSSYPLQPVEMWMSAIRKAGFASGMFSQGMSDDSNTQQLLIGCNRVITDPSRESFMQPAASLPEKKTVVYKQVGSVQIEADIFLPAKAPAEPMPIALMLHGGGHMTLSRKAIRPAQTAHLLANGILPLSLDYRLCPEINIIDGAMADIRDAFIWARRTLPSLMDSRGITLDTERIVVIGWSTGGHLAMSTAWTVEAAGETRPKAILSFYAPTDFLTRDVFPRRSTSLIPHRMSRKQILEISLLEDPITNYEMHGGESPELGWVKSGDPRSELLLSLFRESKEYGLSLMLNGKLGTQQNVAKLVSDPPNLEKQEAICPTARLRAGGYKVPTFIIHGEEDEIALFESASRFHEEMNRQGIKSGFLAVKNGHHIHDLRLKPGMAKWDEQVAPGYQFLFDVLKN